MRAACRVVPEQDQASASAPPTALGYYTPPGIPACARYRYCKVRSETAGWGETDTDSMRLRGRQPASVGQSTLDPGQPTMLNAEALLITRLEGSRWRGRQAGEIVYLGKDGCPRFYDLMRQRAPQYFFAFDLLWRSNLRCAASSNRRWNCSRSLCWPALRANVLHRCQSLLTKGPGVPRARRLHTGTKFSRQKFSVCGDFMPTENFLWRGGAKNCFLIL